MTFYTKVFIINLILIFGMIVLDKFVLKDAIEECDICAGLAGLWFIATWISIPVYLAHLVWVY